MSRKHQLVLLLPLDYGEIDDPTGLAQDATKWKFFFAEYEGGVALTIKEASDIDRAIPIIRQAHTVANALPRIRAKPAIA